MLGRAAVDEVGLAERHDMSRQLVVRVCACERRCEDAADVDAALSLYCSPRHSGCCCRWTCFYLLTEQLLAIPKHMRLSGSDVFLSLT